MNEIINSLDKYIKFTNDNLNMSNIVYAAINLINNKLYIGKTSKSIVDRREKHIRIKKQYQYYFHRALEKYGHNNFIWIILKICNSDREMNSYEKKFIKYYKTYLSEYGYNLTLGGEGCSPNEITRNKISKANKGNKSVWKGKTIPDSAKKKLSEKMKGNTRCLGRKRPVEEKIKIAETLKGRKRPKEVGEKVSKALKGKKWSFELREKIIAGLRKRSKPIIYLNTNIIYDSIPEAAEKLNLRYDGIYKVCTGYLKKYKGHYFKYI